MLLNMFDEDKTEGKESFQSQTILLRIQIMKQPLKNFYIQNLTKNVFKLWGHQVMMSMERLIQLMKARMQLEDLSVTILAHRKLSSHFYDFLRKIFNFALKIFHNIPLGLQKMNINPLSSKISRYFNIALLILILYDSQQTKNSTKILIIKI